MDERQMQAQMIREFIEDRNQKETQKMAEFLEVLSMIESSGGKNFNHDLIRSGIHKGHRAAGRFGLMPNTMQEVYNRTKRDGGDTSLMKPVIQMKPDKMKEYVEKNPEVEQAFAEKLAQHVLDKQGGDVEKAAYSWFKGHNLSPESIEKRNYQDHDYVQKYRKYYDELFGKKLP